MKARTVFTLLALLLLLIGVSTLAAQSGDLVLVWRSVNAGGGRSTGGDLSLAGAIGHWSGAMTTSGDLRGRADFLGPRGGGSVGPPPPSNHYFVPIIVR